MPRRDNLEWRKGTNGRLPEKVGSIQGKKRELEPKKNPEMGDLNIRGGGE